MKKKLMCLLVWLCCLLAYSEVTNPLNPVEDEYNQIKMPTGKQKKSGWIGKVDIVNEGVNAGPCLLLTGPYAVQAAKYNTNHPRHCSDGILDRPYTLSAMVKGIGVLRYGVKSVMQRGLKKKQSNTVNWGEEVTLTDKWQKISIIGQDGNPYCCSHQIIFRLSDNSKALIDEVQFKYIHHENPKLIISSKSLIGAPGDKIKIKATISDNSPVMARTFASAIGSHMVSEEVVNHGVFQFTIPENALKSYKIIFSSPKSGVAKEVFVHVASKTQIANFEKVAKEIKVKKHMNILVIGDSLSDFYRGYNYINIIDKLLNKYNPGKVSIKNVGVGGDFMTRVWKRIEGTEGKHGAYRQYMYNNLLKPNPDLIIIFLGANDTKCLNTTNYEIPLVPTKDQKVLYEKMLNYLKKKTGAKIIIVECPSFNPLVCAKNAQKLQGMNRRHNKYGIKKAIINFNNVNKELESEYNLEYIDLFDVTNEHPERNDLFLPTDGVHLTEKGSRFLALEILKHLAKDKK